MRAAGLLVVLLIASPSAKAQTSISDSTRLSQIKQLFAQQQWREIVLSAETDPARSPDVNYYYGTALARLERWSEARRAFEDGRRQQPLDKRFPLELAGLSFKLKNYSEATRYLRRALRLDPTDNYTNDFLAGVYFLQGNLEAALKHWNRLSKPQISEVRLDPTPRIDPVLLDRAFAFAPATLLHLADLRTTRARVDGLGIFPSYRFDLEARSDGTFDVVFRARERNGWGTGTLHGLLSLFRGLPFQTIHPEFFNIRHRAINSLSLIRWDKEKQRLWTNLSGPLSKDPRWRYHLDLDLRNENWDLRETSDGPPTARLNVARRVIGAGVTSFDNERTDWTVGVELSHREFRDVIPGASLSPELLAQGFQLKQLAEINYELVRVPERRLVVRSSASTQLARTWSAPSHAFAKVQSSVRLHWLPQATGDDYAMQHKIQAGKTFGEIPFDELFVLGVERDNDLWLRAHIGTRDGRKGSAPLGRNYLLSNWEFDKNVYSNGLVTLKFGPFLDNGKIFDSTSGLGSRKWLCDLGLQAKVRVVGVGLRFSYGKDLRSGNNAFYVTFR